MRKRERFFQVKDLPESRPLRQLSRASEVITMSLFAAKAEFAGI